MLIIGLTGGIASGKTSVTDRFAALGAPVIDADLLAREVVEPRSEGLAAVIEAFGSDYLDTEGALDRARLRERIFSDDDARRQLEAIVHPRIRVLRQQRLEEARASGAPYCINAVPLLLETGLDAQCDRVLVVDAPESVQIQRIQARDGGDVESAQAVIARQIDRNTRLQRADDVIDNSAETHPDTALTPQVEALDRKYRRLAAQRCGPDGR